MLRRSVALAGLALAVMAGAPAFAYDDETPGYVWSGLSIGIGGGVGILSADISAAGSRADDIGACLPIGGNLPTLPGDTIIDVLDNLLDNLNDDCETFVPLIGLTQTHALDLNSMGDAGFFGIVQLAYDQQVSRDVVIGAFVDADWASDLEASASSANAATLNVIGIPLLPLLSANAQSEVEHDWTVSLGGRIGWLASPSTLFYMLAAYTHVELDKAQVQFNVADPLGLLLPLIDSPTQLAVNFADSMDGYTLGAGVETKLSRAVSLKFEYRYTDLEGVSASASNVETQCCIAIIGRQITEEVDADLDLDIHTVRAVLSYQLHREEPRMEPLK